MTPAIVQTYLPDFCWQTRREIASMLGKVLPLRGEKTLDMALNKLSSRGVLISRRRSLVVGKTKRLLKEYRRAA